MDIVIKQLSEALIPDFLHFFDHIAFTDNPDWSGCYCHFYHETCDTDEWMRRTATANREATVERIKTGKHRGYLAYDSATNQPVGWMNVNDKANYPRLAAIPDFADDHSPIGAGSKAAVDSRIGAIVCYIIAPEFRRQGIATQLLARAIADYTAQGYDYLEAYPAKNIGGGDDQKSDAHHYHGPTSMYHQAGFTLHRELKHADIVRKKLKE